MKRRLIAKAKLGHHDSFSELYKRHHLGAYGKAPRKIDRVRRKR